MSDSYRMRGRVAAILPAETYPSGFMKQTLVLRDESNPKFPQELAFDFCRDSIQRLVGLAANQEIEVAFSITGREYNGRRYTSLRGWGVKAITDAAPIQAAAPVNATAAPSAAPVAAAPAAARDDSLDDLPF